MAEEEQATVPASSGDDRPDEMTRRGFVGWAAGIGGAFVALVLGVPAIGSLFNSAGQAEPTAFVKVADVASLPTGEPFGITFAEQAQDAYLHTLLPHNVWAVKHSDTDVAVFSPVCPHLGCQVAFDKQKNIFACPCHDSTFSVDGARLGGPAPRGLDSLPSKVKDGALLVQYVQYKPGVADKTPV